MPPRRPTPAGAIRQGSSPLFPPRGQIQGQSNGIEDILTLVFKIKMRNRQIVSIVSIELLYCIFNYCVKGMSKYFIIGSKLWVLEGKRGLIPINITSTCLIMHVQG